MSIPSTFEMDSLFTQEDIDNRFIVYIQCRKCSKWTMFNMNDENKICKHCNSTELDPQSTTSKRTFNPLNKRKIK